MTATTRRRCSTTSGIRTSSTRFDTPTRFRKHIAWSRLDAPRKASTSILGPRVETLQRPQKLPRRRPRTTPEEHVDMLVQKLPMTMATELRVRGLSQLASCRALGDKPKLTFALLAHQLHQMPRFVDEE